VADLRRTVQQQPDYPPLLFFYQGTVEDGQAFFDRLWPEARAVSDKAVFFYKRFQIERGGLREVLNPEVLACGVRAAGKGNTGGMPIGDPWIMPGLFLVRGERILWQHDFKHIGDHPDWAKLPLSVEALKHSSD
jgi:hypothetical protein